MSQSNILGLPNFRPTTTSELARAEWVAIRCYMIDRWPPIWLGHTTPNGELVRVPAGLNRTGAPARLHAAAALELPVLVDQYELVLVPAYAR
jgi:hypothetical protein